MSFHLYAAIIKHKLEPLSRRYLLSADVALKTSILKDVENGRDAIIKLCSDLVKIPSENPPGDVSEVAGFVKDQLSQSGARVETYEPEKGRVNLVVRLGPADRGHGLILNGHIDVVPAGDHSRWTIGPYSGEVRDGYIHGRGATDMKGGLTGIIAATELISRHQERLKGQLILTAVCDEETIGKLGTMWLMNEEKVSGDYCIVAEPTGNRLIDVGQKGAFWLRIRCKGKPAHGSLSPYMGTSAILEGLSMSNRLMELTKLKARPPADICRTIQQSKSIADKMLGVKGIGRILEHPTVNVGKIVGGRKVNMVPDECEVEVDSRLPIGMCTEEVEAALKRILRVQIRMGTVSYQVANRTEPNYTCPKSPLVSALKYNIRKISGRGASTFVQWATSDARFFRASKIDTVQHGPSVLEGIHGYNEKVRADDVVNATKVYAATALDLCC
jgi:succinyl-diaminopimelate desuccinylase